MLRKTDHGPPESNRLSSLYGSVQGGLLHLTEMDVGIPMAGQWASLCSRAACLGRGVATL